MKLQERLPDTINANGRRYRMDFDFRNVLRMMDTLSRDDLMPEARSYLALKCLMKRPPKDAGKVGAALGAARRILFPESPAAGQESGKKLTSFEQDAGMIRAAFRQCYRIDLWRERLHWIEFTELLNSLPEGSRYAEVLGIRARPVPAPTKYNQKEREWLLKAKAACAIHMTDAEQEKNYQESVSRLFAGLMGMIRKAESAEAEKDRTNTPENPETGKSPEAGTEHEEAGEERKNAPARAESGEDRMKAGEESADGPDEKAGETEKAGGTHGG